MMNGMSDLFAIVFSLIALIASLASVVIVLAFKFSTHQIEFRPLVQEPMKEVEPFKEEDEDDKVLFDALKLQKSKKKKIEDPLEEITATSNF